MREKSIIGIVGGNGKMGTWFRRFFEDEGYTVLISDKDTELSNAELVKKSDVVLFSVPIDVTSEVIESVLPESREAQLWMDTTSIKALSVPVMRRSKAEVLGMHPMFGPSISSLKGQTLILCEDRIEKWSGWFGGIVQKHEGRIKKTTAKEHDKMMATIQGLTHFSLISLGYAFKELGLDIEESLEYTSPIYRMRLDMVGRILAQDPRLYADIAILNPETQEVMRSYINSIMKLYMLIKDEDTGRFMEFFRESADHLGGFRQKAMEESTYLIRRLVEKET